MVLEGNAGPPATVPVVIYGFGRVGRAVLELALTRPWLDVRGIIARSPDRDGELASRSVADAPGHLRVRADAAAVLREARPHVVIVATTSRLLDVIPQLELAASSGARAVICTAEELAFVRPEDGGPARAIVEMAREWGVSILAAGVNPGFVLDLWPLVLSGLAWDIERLEARRVVDVSVFAPHTRRQLGIGHDAAAFEAGVADGTIAGHLGFRESLHVLCGRVGRDPERITIETTPVLAEDDYRVADQLIPSGTSVGVTQRAVAWADGKPWISIDMLLHVAPSQAGIRPVDEAHLYGSHELHVTLDPGCAAILSTAAQLVNSIPNAVRADPGVYGPGQLPPASPWLAASSPI